MDLLQCPVELLLHLRQPKEIDTVIPIRKRRIIEDADDADVESLDDLSRANKKKKKNVSFREPLTETFLFTKSDFGAFSIPRLPRTTATHRPFLVVPSLNLVYHSFPIIQPSNQFHGQALKDDIIPDKLSRACLIVPCIWPSRRWSNFDETRIFHEVRRRNQTSVGSISIQSWCPRICVESFSAEMSQTPFQLRTPILDTSTAPPEGTCRTTADINQPLQITTPFFWFIWKQLDVFFFCFK